MKRLDVGRHPSFLYVVQQKVSSIDILLFFYTFLHFFAEQFDGLKIKKMKGEVHFFSFLFAYVKKKQYLCTRF